MLQGHYKLDIEISTPPDNGTAMSWHTIEAGLTPSNERNLMSQTFAEETLRLNIAEILKHTPLTSLDKLEIVLWWKNLSRDANRTKQYTYEAKFGIGTGLSHDIVFGKDDPRGMFPGYSDHSDPFEGAVKLELSKSRSNSWVSKLGKKSPSWASSKHTSRRSPSSKRGSISRPDTSAQVQREHNSPKPSAGADVVPSSKTDIPNSSGAGLRLSRTNDGSGAALSSNRNEGLQNAAGNSNLKLEQSAAERANQHEQRVKEAPTTISDSPSQQCRQADAEGVGTASSPRIQEVEAIIPAISTIEHRDFGITAEGAGPPLSEEFPMIHLDTETTALPSTASGATDPIQHSPLPGDDGREYPFSVPRPEQHHQPSLLGTTNPWATPVARSVASDYSRSPLGCFDSNLSEPASNSMKSGSMGSREMDVNPILPGPEGRHDIEFEVPRTSPNIPSGNQDHISNTPQPESDQQVAPSPTRPHSEPEKTSIPTKYRRKDAGSASKHSSSKSSSRHRKKYKKYGRPANLISPKRVAPESSNEVELPSAANAEKTTWTWDENANAYWHIDSDTQSRIWYEDSGSEDLENL
jgi:hypothetical protein